MQKYLNEIIKNDIVIDNRNNIVKYLDNYGYFRIIVCYGNLTRIIKNQNEITTNEIIDIFNIDNMLANVINGYLLDFEKQLNNKVIDIIFKHHNLNENYILEIIKNPANSHLRNKGFATFNNDIYENSKQCNLINNLNLNVNEIPLKILSTSWTLNTLINFIYLQDEQTKKIIANYYGFNEDYESFISICHTIRKLRNTISHNGIFINFEINHYIEPFNYWLNEILNKKYDLNSNINLFKSIEMLSILLKINVKNILKNKISNLETLTNIKEHIIKKFI